ncbi:ABC transporter permease [candidate division KSB1 bacterium]|nr:ABC transporter permease [candidate division KSB1 bacterium]
MRAFLRVWIINLAPAFSAFAVATLLAALLLLVSGYQTGLALRALLEGAFGSAYALSETLVKSIPLLLTGAAVALAFRAGVWNIGAEGQFLAGALAASALAAAFSASGWMTGVLGIALLLLAGGVAGGLWAGLAGVMKNRRGVPEVVSTILLNFIAIELVRGNRGTVSPVGRARCLAAAGATLSAHALARRHLAGARGGGIVLSAHSAHRLRFRDAGNGCQSPGRALCGD